MKSEWKRVIDRLQTFYFFLNLHFIIDIACNEQHLIEVVKGNVEKETHAFKELSQIG